jgi:hypothetical protein
MPGAPRPGRLAEPISQEQGHPEKNQAADSCTLEGVFAPCCHVTPLLRQKDYNPNLKKGRAPPGERRDSFQTGKRRLRGQGIPVRELNRRGRRRFPTVKNAAQEPFPWLRFFLPAEGP